MSKIFNIDVVIKQILDNYWKLYYNDIYISLSNSYAIRITKDKSQIWFEVDQEPLMSGCYIYCSRDLREVFDWCYDNLNLDILYY